MGIDVYVFKFLMKFAGNDLGDMLCLGRQGLHIQRGTPPWDMSGQILSQHDPAYDVSLLFQSDGYAETFLKYLGARSVRSLDYSSFEGAEVVHDLNTPIPRGLYERFDTIFDGGTTEHVFDIPTALANVKHMLRPNGRYLSVNAANNQLGHGLYQFSPELFWRAFGSDAGFIMETMQLVPMSYPLEATELCDHEGVREQMQPTPTATYLMFSARLSRSGRPERHVVYQSDYVARWKAP